MPKRVAKPRDVNQLAADIVNQATSGQPETPPPAPPTVNGKNPAAVALGRLGGAKGGNARAKNLTKKELSAIGRKGAAARWPKKGRKLRG